MSECDNNFFENNNSEIMQSRTDREPTLIKNHQVVGEAKVKNTDVSVIIIQKFYEDGRAKNTKYEINNNTGLIVNKSVQESNGGNANALTCREINCDTVTFQFPTHLIDHDPMMAVVKQLKKPESTPSKGTIVCQNCEMNFPTKYQYQRHQCEFNAAKVVLKANADMKDVDKGMRMKYECSTCSKQFVSKNNLDRHQTSHDESNVNICEHCQKHFVSENRLRIHKENHCKKAGDISKFYRSDVAVWQCIKCNRVFATVTSANKHAANCNELAIDDNVRQSNRNDSDALNGPLKSVVKVLTELLLQCEFCNRTYADKALLLQHQRTHTTTINYVCVRCDETFDSYVTAAKHWLTKCSDEENLFYLPKLTYCEYCDRTFKSHDVLYTHKIKKKHYTPKAQSTNGPVAAAEDGTKDNKSSIVKLIEDTLMAINVPNLTPNEPANVKKEVEMQPTTENVIDITVDRKDEEMPPPEKKKKRGRKSKQSKQQSIGKNKRISATAEPGYKYQCERCIKEFDGIADLELHREIEHPTNFKCDECSQVVHSAKALLIHSRAHQSLKPYVCEICKRCYSQTSHLWQHMRFHQGIKPFACPHAGCEARYTIRPDLKDHIRKVHTRERPFKCAVCNKCFLTGSVYYQHRLIHTNDRRYGCDICQKRFFRADALNNHRRIHTDERPYPCEICGRQFRQKGDRNKHVRTQHPSS